MRRLIVLVVILIVVLSVLSAVTTYLPQINILPKSVAPNIIGEKVKVVSEESATINAVKKIGPSVITVAEESPPQQQIFNFGPFSIFGLPQEQAQPQSIGSGFIVSSDGFIVTNKHVVSDIGAKYQVISSNDKKYKVQKIYRDPLNDIAILKINPGENPGQTLKPVEMGDSSKLQVGQFAVAIGTALGEFRNTVTTGVISGLGRGITAGDQFQGYVEKLDNVIQTSAAINPGNSGGPLVNSSSQVIGINTAIASSGQNIGFALPINIVKDSLKNFSENGEFQRPYLGIVYRAISRDVALLNNVPEGDYVQDVVVGSVAEKAGIQRGDIITKVNGKRITANNEISNIINELKVGDTISISLWRNGKTIDISATLQSAPNQ